MIKRKLDAEVAKRLLKGLDCAGFATVGFIAATLAVTHADAATPALNGTFVLTLTFLCLFILRGLGLYESRALANLPRVALLSFGVVALTGIWAALGATICGLHFDLPWYKLWITSIAVYMAVTRSLVHYLQRGQADGRQRIAIVGGGKAAEDAIAALEHSMGLDIEIVGLFDDRYDNRSPTSVRKHQKLGTIAELSTFARNHTVDLIIVAIPISAEQRLLQILKRIWELPVDIRVSGQSAQLRLSQRAYSYLGDLPLLPVFDRPLSPWSEFLKNAVDRTVALLALIALAPVMAGVALAVRLESKGPVLFKQKRFGFNNELIEVYKFRSMYTEMSDATAATLVSKNDPRVTRVGRIIRKSSLDELPQLFNVLAGGLSLVGPRPHATQAKATGGLYDEVVEGYFARHKVKPGITGWAQINGWRGETDTIEKIEQRVKHDLEYIDRWSLALDLYILMKTPFALLKSENAY